MPPIAEGEVQNFMELLRCKAETGMITTALEEPVITFNVRLCLDTNGSVINL